MSKESGVLWHSEEGSAHTVPGKDTGLGLTHFSRSPCMRLTKISERKLEPGAASRRFEFGKTGDKS